jgi:hypothetical protein
MFEQSDWLMRVVKQFTEALARVLLARENQRPELGLATVEALVTEELQLPLFGWRRLDRRMPDDLHNDGPRIALLARLLDLRAQLEWDCSNAEDALRAELMADRCRERMAELRYDDPFVGLLGGDTD